MTGELAVQNHGIVNFEEYAMSTEAVVRQVNVIQDVMRSVMRVDEHYGTIPGCQKPSLYKPGAEKLGFTFRLAPEYDVRTINMAGGHREYQVKCRLRHIPTGSMVGEGEGSCTTMEGKYRFRGGEKTGTGEPVPKEYWNLKNAGKMAEAKDLIGGEGYAPGKIDGKWEICSIGEKVEHDNPADYYNCVSPDTKVLTHDLQWIRAGDIVDGDILIGVEENMTNEYARHFSLGEAKVYGTKIDQLYEIEFEDGRSVKCNGEHKWLVKKVGLKGTEWVSTQDIYHEIFERKGRPRNWSVMSVSNTWEEDTSKEAGYIAGLLDADGSLGSTQLFVMFAQQQNIVLSLINHGLSERGYKTNMDSVISREVLEGRESKKPVYQIRVLGGFSEQLRLLGSIRPPRLLDRWFNLIDISCRRLEGRGSGSGRPLKIVSVNPIGDGEVVLLGTSCHTYIAEGLVCHNTCLKMAKKRAHVDAILTATAASDIFTQDVEDMTEVMGGAQTRQQETTQGKKEKPPMQPPQEKAPQSDTVVVSVIVAEVFEQEGVNKKTGKPYTKYTIKDESGIEYGTFSKSFAQFAHESIGTGFPIKITYKQSKFGNDIENVTLPEGQATEG